MENCSENLLGKRLHVVCPAYCGLNPYGAMSCAVSLDHDEAMDHALRVNRANEAGTLYPRYPLTILPLTVFEARNDSGNRELMGKHVMDAFEANERYWKIPKLVFNLGGYSYGQYFDEALCEEVIKEKLQTTDFVHTRLVFLAE